MSEAKLKRFGLGVQKLVEGRSLSRAEARAMFTEVLRNEQPDLQQGAFLAALAAKGETAEEIAGAWEAIDALDTEHVPAGLPEPLCENSGTGMDRLKTFNVSSAAAIVASACGVNMARHGARALTSFCGTVDIMEAVGLDVDCDVELVARSIRQTGIGLFNGMSPKVHPGALGRILSQIRFGSTLNIAASLANPARPTLGLRGVHSRRLVGPVAQAMRAIGYQRGMVVHGTDERSGLGMDEISPCGPTEVHEFGPEAEQGYQLRPEDVGLEPVSFDEIATTGDLDKERRRFVAVLAGRDHAACQSFTCLNAGAVLLVAGRSSSLAEAVEQCRQAIGQGRALDKLRDWLGVQNGTSGRGPQRLEAML